MKFKNGAPKKLYVIVWQDDGRADTYTNMKERDEDWSWMVDSDNNEGVKATYELVESSVTKGKGKSGS